MTRVRLRKGGDTALTLTPLRPRRRLAPVAGPRCFHCLHVQKELKLQRQAVKERYMGNAIAKRRAALSPG